MSAADDVPVAVIASPFWVLPTLLVLIFAIWWIRIQIKYRTGSHSSATREPLRRVMPTGMTEQDREWLHRHYDICGAIMERRPPPYIELPPGKMTYMEWRHAYYDAARRRNELAEKVRQSL